MNNIVIVLFVKYKRKKKWRVDLTETIGAYKGLGLLKLQSMLFTSVEENMA